MGRKSNLLLLAFLLTLTTAYGQLRDSVLVKTPIFEVMYSETKEQPLWVKYTARPIVKVADRKGLDFYTEKDYHTSDNNDYANNVYDKGHCAPAADFNCTREMLLSTFSYLNCVLQHQDLNRGAWRLLEEHERQLSSTGTVKVSILMVYSPSSIKLTTGATVPDGFYKYITVNGKTTIYYFKNERPATTDYKQYVVAKGPKLTIK